MTRARDLADVISGQFDVPSGSLDNVPAADLVNDTTPQLGGNLDVQTHSIVSVSNQDIAITPNGTGSIVLDGLNWPQADGSAGQLLKTDGSGQLSFVNDAGGMDWSASPKTASFTAEAGKGYFVDTSSSAITVTLPASPSTGDRVAIIDYKENANTNNIIVEDNGSKFQGETVNFVTLSTAGVSAMLIYSDSGQGWVSGYSDTDTDSAITYPSYTVDVLVVAGGGGGTRGTGTGGCGAGGYLEGTMSLEKNTSYTVTIGAGGARAASANLLGNNGSNTVFNGATALGGGYGALNGGGQGSNGGSGGGGGGAGVNGSGRAGGDSTQTNSGGLTGYGNDGSDSYNYSSYTGSGGGGAGAAGNANSGTTGGAGGAGRTWSVDSTTYAGGGGGGTESGTAGSGGSGGGGNGSVYNNGSSKSGTANTGGGAGGDGGNTSGAAEGGSGVVKLRILTTDYSGTSTGSPTVTTSGSYTFLTFTGSGSYTA